MAIFNNMVITTKGEALYNKVQAGISLNFTKMKIGSGQLAEGDNPEIFTGLKNYKFDVSISSVTPNTQLQVAVINGTINNTNITEGQYICELGLFAEDPDEGEILYGYASAGTQGDYIAPNNKGAFAWNYQVNAAVGNATEVTATVSSTTFDYAVASSSTTFAIIHGTNQKEINESIDTTFGLIQNTVNFEPGSYTATQDNTTSFIIDVPYNPSTDHVEFFYLGNQRMEPNDNYTLTGTRVDLVDWSLKSGEKITYNVWKFVNNVPIMADGSNLQDNSVASRSLTEDVQENINQVPILASQMEEKVSLIPLSLLAKIKNKIDVPDNFTWKNIGFNVFRKRNGDVITDLDINSLRPTGKTYYVDVVNGNDSNDGLTLGTALKSVRVGVLKSDAEVVKIADGFYQDMYSSGNSTYTKKIALIAINPGNVILSTIRLLTWTKTTGQTYVYQASRSQVATVIDRLNLDSKGDYKKLTHVASISLCDSTPNSYYTDGSILYVHAYNNRVADDNICPLLDLINFRVLGNFDIWLEGIEFIGGNVGAVNCTVSSTDSAKITAIGCKFKYSTGGNGGLSVVGADSLMYNCINAKNYADGFNYHIGSGRLSQAVEIGCEGYENGLDRGTNTNNGSTAHDGYKVVRINGEYYENEGPNIHDINANTESWNVGCDSHNSSATVSARKVNYYSEDSAKVFIESSVGHDSYRNVYNSSTSTVYIKNSAFDDNPISNNGTLVEY